MLTDCQKIHVDLSTSDTCQVNRKFGHSEKLSGKRHQLHPNYCGRAPGLARSAKTVTGGGSCSNPADHCATPSTEWTCGARLELPRPIAETRPWHGVCFAHAINAGAFWWDVFFHSPLNMGKNFTFNATFHFFWIFACKLGKHGILSFYKCFGMFSGLCFPWQLFYCKAQQQSRETGKSRGRGSWAYAAGDPKKGGTGINSFPGLPQVMIKATGTHPSVLKSNWSIHLHLLFRATYCMRSWPYKNHWHHFLCINEPFMYSNDVEHTCRIWQIIFDKAHTEHSKIIEGKYCHHHQTNKKTVTCLVFHQPRLKQEIPQWHSFAGPLLLPSDFDFAIGNKTPCQGKGSFDKNTLLPNLNSKRYAFQCFLSSGAACAPYVGCNFRISNLSYHFCVFFPGKTEH